MENYKIQGHSVQRYAKASASHFPTKLTIKIAVTWTRNKVVGIAFIPYDSTEYITPFSEGILPVMCPMLPTGTCFSQSK